MYTNLIKTLTNYRKSSETDKILIFFSSFKIFGDCLTSAGNLLNLFYQTERGVKFSTRNESELLIK